MTLQFGMDGLLVNFDSIRECRLVYLQDGTHSDYSGVTRNPKPYQEFDLTNRGPIFPASHVSPMAVRL